MLFALLKFDPHYATVVSLSHIEPTPLIYFAIQN